MNDTVIAIQEREFFPSHWKRAEYRAMNSTLVFSAAKDDAATWCPN